MISVVLATYNEEENIRRCLEAASEFADEMIVVDGSSPDKTKKLAEDLGATVISTSNKQNFHINKQMAMDAATGELVMQLDADEVADEELVTFILETHKQILEPDYDGPVAWYLKRKNLFLGHFFKKTGQYPDPVIRLYINGHAWLPQQDVHEQMEVDGDVAWAEGHLIHYANPNFRDYLRKWNRYTSFRAQQLADDQIQLTIGNSIRYLLWLPLKTFLTLFVRHKGFVDGVPGFVFSVMSGLHHSMAYLKLWELYEVERIQEEADEDFN